MDISFGGKIQQFDERSFDLHKYNELTGGDAPIPAVYRPDYSDIPVLFQGKIPACGSHAAATLKMIQDKRKNSPRYHWNKVKAVDGLPLSDGMTITSLFSGLRKVGICEYDLLGNDVTLDLSTYSHANITPAMDENASKFRTSSEAYINRPTFDQIKKSVFINGACIILYRCGQNMYKNKNGVTDWSEAILPLSPTNFPMDSGHYVCVIGYDENYIYFRNSWGATWGIGGDGYFGKEYMPFVNVIGTAIDDVPPSIIPKFTKDLFVGISDPQVKLLQQYLNSKGFIVSPSGAGSIGKETEYFGDKTRLALSAWQISHYITPSEGYFGIKSRTVANQG